VCAAAGPVTVRVVVEDRFYDLLQRLRGKRRRHPSRDVTACSAGRWIGPRCPAVPPHFASRMPQQRCPPPNDPTHPRTGAARPSSGAVTVRTRRAAAGRRRGAGHPGGAAVRDDPGRPSTASSAPDLASTRGLAVDFRSWAEHPALAAETMRGRPTDSFGHTTARTRFRDATTRPPDVVLPSSLTQEGVRPRGRWLRRAHGRPVQTVRTRVTREGGARVALGAFA
jgi:hypothetical protein